MRASRTSNANIVEDALPLLYGRYRTDLCVQLLRVTDASGPGQPHQAFNHFVVDCALHEQA
jgi:hypothetical protein